MDKNSFFARTMHTPDSPERAELRGALREISKALIPLHRHLIDAAKSDDRMVVSLAMRQDTARLVPEHEGLDSCGGSRDPAATAYCGRKGLRESWRSCLQGPNPDSASLISASVGFFLSRRKAAAVMIQPLMQ